MSDRDLFQTALDKPDPAAHVDAHADSPAQRERVQQRLAAHVAAVGFLDRAVVEAGPSGDEVLELLKAAIAGPDEGDAPQAGESPGRATPRVAPRADGDDADERPATRARRTGA